MTGHFGTRVLLAISVIAASLICLPYVLRTWPGLPWEWVRFVFVLVAERRRWAPR
jgi:hypothetical protein